MKAIDLFAGWGGFTLGAQMAGVEVVYAANHWPVAVDVHSRNHPSVQHECQDLRQADWTKLPRYDLLLASPACQGHSTASQPRRRAYHDPMRATAWAVVDCADVTEPSAIVVENVPSFTRWRLYPVWREALERLGYRLQEHRVLATHHGVPQRRDRLFVVGLRNGRQIRLPLWLGTEPSFLPCIEFTDDNWRPIASAGPGARARMVAASLLHQGQPCLVQHVTGHRGISVREAIRTITTKAQWTLVEGDRYRWLTTRELARGMGFPESFTWDDSLPREKVIRGLGNAVCPPVGRDVVGAVAQEARAVA